MLNGDTVIRWGFWSQLVFLGMVDWGTIVAMQKGEVAGVHYVGLAVVNVVLLYLAFLMWRWLREQKSRADDQR